MITDARPQLFTIGYEGYSPPSYLQALASRSVTVLCDLRRTTVSRNPGFSRLALGKACGDAGIRYEHLWQLGAHSEKSQARRASEERDILLDDYRLRTLPTQQRLLEAIHRWLRDGERVALTCYERHPDVCHRSCVAEHLHQTFGEPCTPIHL